MTARPLARRLLGVHLPLLSSQRVRRQSRPAGLPEAPQAQTLCVEAPQAQTLHAEAPQAQAPYAEAPLALTVRDRGSIRLAALDVAALALGLVPGMMLADARARVPDLQTLPHDPAADAALLDWLADGADRYTPMVAVRPPHGLVLDITGCTHPYGGEAGLVEDLHRRLLRLGLTAGLAVAGTPDAALALAEHAMADVEDLPVTVLAAAEAVHLALRRAGLKTIGAVAHQHRPALAARFGEAMLSRRWRG